MAAAAASLTRRARHPRQLPLCLSRRTAARPPHRCGRRLIDVRVEALRTGARSTVQPVPKMQKAPNRASRCRARVISATVSARRRQDSVIDELSRNSRRCARAENPSAGSGAAPSIRNGRSGERTLAQAAVLSPGSTESSRSGAGSRTGPLGRPMDGRVRCTLARPLHSGASGPPSPGRKPKAQGGSGRASAEGSLLAPIRPSQGRERPPPRAQRPRYPLSRIALVADKPCFWQTSQVVALQ
jgi:hypothetical protein